MTRWVFNEDGWTDWIDHDGKGCPCVGWWAEAEAAEPWDHDEIVWRGEGMAGNGKVSSWMWGPNGYTDIIRYRVRKPKGAEMLEKLVQDVPEPVDA